jgi:hypothetical protein
LLQALLRLIQTGIPALTVLDDGHVIGSVTLQSISQSVHHRHQGPERESPALVGTSER